MTNPDYERGFYQHITASFFLRLPCHPIPEAFITNELTNSNGFIDSLVLVRITFNFELVN